MEMLNENPFMEFLEEHIVDWALALILLVLGIPLVRILNRNLTRFFEKVDLDETVEIFTTRVLNFTLWFVLLTMVLDNLGLDITGLFAAMGLAGLAIAFAAQDTLSNVFSGIFIMMDRPFKIGDRILLPTKLGSLYSSWGDVVDIGLRTTNVRSTDGIILTIPNKLITSNPLANFSHLKDPSLRVRIRLGLVPTAKNVEFAEVILLRLSNGHPDVQQDPKRPQVVLRELRDSDVVMELRFYVDSPKKMRSTKSDILKSMLSEFEKEGVKLSYPVRVNLEAQVQPGDLGFEDLQT